MIERLFRNEWLVKIGRSEPFQTFQYLTILFILFLQIRNLRDEYVILYK